ncbi:aromatic acid exporter family protein [Bacillus sp. AK128]
MNKQRFTFVGGRIIKTGIAVFLTAFICHMLNWPAMYAVITAIVTIEPTVGDSIKKAFVRFPASVIGAGLAVVFTYLLGDTPYTYALVAFTTIISCHKLKLHDGTLVATLTGVAMISTVHDHYAASLFIRLGTTSTGLIVSTLVNFFILPPNYSRTIANEVQSLFQKSGVILEKRANEWFQKQPADKKIRQDFQYLIKHIDKAETICQYQKEEWKYHRVNRKAIRLFHYEFKKLILLRQLVFHIGNLVYLPFYHVSIEESRKKLILSTVTSIKNTLSNQSFLCEEDFHHNMEEVSTLFSNQHFSDHEISETGHHISPETAILYELLSIHDLINELCKVQSLEMKYLNQG